MGGKFIKTTYVDSVESLVNTTVNAVKNANYLFNDKPPVISTWFNQNTKKTTFDEGSRAEYSYLDNNSSIYYNKISKAVFYSSGIRLQVELEYNDDGLSQSSPSTINGTVLPNTYIPYAGDYFYIEHSDTKWLYKVTNVSFDTIDNGNNVYSFDAVLDNCGIDNIENKVVERYKMIVNNIGTDFRVIVKDEEYDIIEKLDNILTFLKDNFIALFYNVPVQTFTYNGKYAGIYDSYMIEFIKRNNILSGSTNYIYLTHEEVPIPQTFGIDYAKTMYRAIELKDKKRFSTGEVGMDYIDNQFSLFNTVLDQYFKLTYNDNRAVMKYTVLDPELENRVKEGRLYENGDDNIFFNIIIKYMNDMEENYSSLINMIDKIEFEHNQDMFYSLPIIIYIIERYIENLLKTTI